MQQALIDGMARYAEQKFGRKRAAPKGGKARNAMDDYDIYLRSLKSKVKTSNDRLAGVLKQKRVHMILIRSGEQYLKNLCISRTSQH